MKRYRDVLQEFALPLESTLGGGKPRGERPDFDVARFRAELAIIRRSYTMWVIVCGASVIAVTTATVIMLLRCDSNPALLAGAVTALMTLFAFAARELRDRTRIEMLLTLAATMDKTVLDAIVATLARTS